jgi:hypothetical protein
MGFFSGIVGTLKIINTKLKEGKILSFGSIVPLWFVKRSNASAFKER